MSELRLAGWQPVILSRGYKGKSGQYPLQVTAESRPEEAGDEPVMLAASTGCPVVVDPDRRRGADHALGQGLGNLLVCDDGLQHYRLPRDLELAVFDGQRGIGNGALIPVGPLREPVSRLDAVDFVIVNGLPPEDQPVSEFAGIEHPAMYGMELKPTMLQNLRTGETQEVAFLQGQSVRAVAGIGNPGRFFQLLRALGAEVEAVPLADHHRFKASDLEAGHNNLVVMTAKDAVKCRPFASENAWVLLVEAHLPSAFREAFLARVRQTSESLTS